MRDSTLDDYKAIGEQGGTKGLALVANLMDQSARQTADIMESVQRTTERQRDEAIERAERAEAQLEAIERRIMAMLFNPPTEADFERIR